MKYQNKKKNKSLLENKFPVLYEDLDNDVSKLDIHDGRHSLLLRLEKGRPEANTQIRNGHQILNIQFNNSHS